MKCLAIETSTRLLGVALVEGEQLLASYEALAAGYPHSAELPDAVARVLRCAHAGLSDVGAVAVDIGPGSFTGLRIGLAFVKALALAAEVPVVAVPSLDVLASGVPFAAMPVFPILDAKQKNLYAARYRPEAGRLRRQTDYLLGPVDEVLAFMEEPSVVLGDGCALYRERVLQRCPQAQCAAQELWLPKAATLARLGHERFVHGQRDDPAKLVPLYLYPRDCQVRSADRPAHVIPKLIRVA